MNFGDGANVWHHELLEEYKVTPSFFGIGTSPIVEGDLLVVNVGGTDAGVVAFDRATGKEVWKATSQGASYASPILATIGGERQLIFFTRQGLLSLEPKSGAVRFEKRWRSRMEASVNAATPIFVGDQIFLTSSYNTGAILLKATKNNVQEIWKGDDSLSAHFSTPVYVDGYLYGSDGRQEADARLRCVEFATGKVRWTHDGFGCGWAIAVQGMLLLLSEQGELILADASPKEYKERARFSLLSSPCRAAPALADGRLFARDDRKLVCVDLSLR